MKKELLEEYAALKATEKTTADRLQELKPLIVEEMRAEDADKVATAFGSFTLGSQTRWQYSPAVEKLQELEKANGKARAVTSTVLRFSNKES